MNRPATLATFAALSLAALGACAGPSATPGPAASPTAPNTATSTRPAGNLPDRALTPGKVMTTDLGVICGQPTALRRNVTEATKERVYASYRVTTHTAATYQLDHLIPLELGGDNTDTNLWPEPADPRPGFHEKDTLEDTLHALVCDKRTLAVEVAQAAIATDWVTAYRTYVTP